MTSVTCQLVLVMVTGDDIGDRVVDDESVGDPSSVPGCEGSGRWVGQTRPSVAAGTAIAAPSVSIAGGSSGIYRPGRPYLPSSGDFGRLCGPQLPRSERQ